MSSSGAAATTAAPTGAEPLTILIGALGGEGGGVLTEWLVAAAMARGLPVQSTSIPGVAQRTGATTYYLEIFPVSRGELNGERPILALYPSPGGVDLAVMSELVEAGRAMENGFVTPGRTMLVASSHRVYAIAEKAALGDGRFDSERILRAADELAQRTLLFDMDAAARQSGSVISAVILGAVAGSGVLPFAPEDFQRAIRGKGVAVEANLRGFAAGLQRAREGGAAPNDSAPNDSVQSPGATEPGGRDSRPLPGPLGQRIESGFPEAVRDMVTEGVRRLIDYQGARYADLYLDRLVRVAAADAAHGGPIRGHVLTLEAARHLALWMSYEDAIRVADLKTSRARMAHVRAEAGAEPGQPVRIVEYLDPGLEEITAVMPPFLARFLLGLSKTLPWLGRFRRPMRVRSDTVSGFLKLWLMARLRPIRPRSSRYAKEQALIARWLDTVDAAARLDYEFGLEVVRCARLIKGYGDTYERGWSNFQRILAALVHPVLQTEGNLAPSAERMRRAREAALAEPEGTALEQVLAEAASGGAAGTPPDPVDGDIPRTAR